MRKLLEMLLEQLQGMVNHITTTLASMPEIELSIEDQRFLEIGKAVHAAATTSTRCRILANLYTSGKDENGEPCFVFEDYAGMIVGLISWEHAFDGKDRDSVLSVYEVASDHDLDDSDDLDDFISKAEDAVALANRINEETNHSTDDDDEIIEALNNSCSEWEDAKDAVERAYHIMQNW